MIIVEVVWNDAYFRMSDYTLKQAIKKMKVQLTRSIGYLVAETDEGIILCQTTGKKKNKDLSEHLIIPWGMVVEYWKLYD